MSQSSDQGCSKIATACSSRSRPTFGTPRVVRFSGLLQRAARASETGDKGPYELGSLFGFGECKYALVLRMI